MNISMESRKPELLAPAGGKPHLIAAVKSGADAVYMGGMSFNARIFADNFSDEELPEAIRYAHAHGVKVYITINTLIADAELARAFEYCNYIYKAGADGVIIQDMGLARLLHLYLPDLPLHLSTQGTVYNTEALGPASKMGFARVVPARELNLDEIRSLAAEGRAMTESGRPMDIEVFVHGSMCMCYSGQCQMSRMLGGGSGRSGNRGTCAQPCRHPYTDENGRTYYALSPKDLCLIDRIPELVESGAASFKIEGRIKSPEYVAVVTGVYRKYIDRYFELLRSCGPGEAARLYKVSAEDRLRLRQIFNRGDFTEGYLHGNPGSGLLSGASPKNQGVYLGRVIAVIDNENKLSERDEKAAARGALKRGKVLVCIAADRDAAGQGIRIGPGDGVEFRSGDTEGQANTLPGGVATYIKDIGHGHFLAGDFDRGAAAGDGVFRVTDRTLIDSALDLPEKKLPVTMLFTARKGQYPTLVMTDVKNGESVEVSADHVVETARKTPTEASRIESSLARLGDTPYNSGITGIDIETDDDIMMPVSIINRMRREASEKLLEIRLGSVTKCRRPALGAGETARIREYEALGSGRLDPEECSKRIEESGIIPVPLTEFMNGGCPKGAVPYILNVSRGALDAYIRENFGLIADACKETGILIGNLGWIEQFRDSGVRVYGDYGLNIYNLQALRAYEELGVSMYMPSHETGVSDERGVPLMISEHIPDALILTDRKGRKHFLKISENGDKSLTY